MRAVDIIFIILSCTVAFFMILLYIRVVTFLGG